MAGRLEGKVAIITGGARGQGATEARLFVEEGARVVIGDVLDEEGELVAKELGDACRYVHHDVTNEDEWSAIVALAQRELGGVDVLVNNAGIFKNGPLTTTSVDDYMKVVNVNQLGVFLGMRAVAPALIEARGGSIVNISSIAGLRGSQGTIAYTASKFAVRGMTKVAALELAPFGVRVNSIHPGFIDTPMLAQVVPAGVEGVAGLLAGSVPLGECAAPDEVARLALFLASEDSRHCTGSEFVVDGGLTAGIGTRTR